MKIVLSRPCCFSQLGKRENQEDCLYPKESDGQTSFFVVCDGVGGREHGEVASELVCQTFEQNLTDEQCRLLRPEEIQELVREAYRSLYKNRAICPTMATTLAFMAKTDDGMLTAHLGDSRIYQVRRNEGVVFQTKDHSFVNELMDRGEITPGEAIGHPQRNVITRCLYVANDEACYESPSISLIRDIKAHDVFLLCTDGVYSMMTNDDISEILSSDYTLEEKRQELAAICRDSDDNNTAYLIEINSVEGRVGNERNIFFDIDRKESSNNQGFLHKLLNWLSFAR